MTQNVLVQFDTFQRLVGDKRIGSGVDSSERNDQFLLILWTHKQTWFLSFLTCLPEPLELSFGEKLATCYWFSFCQNISTNLIMCNFRSLSSSSCAANPGFMGDRGKSSSTASKWCMWFPPLVSCVLCYFQDHINYKHCFCFHSISHHFPIQNVHFLSK